MSLDFGSILGRAWKITWNNKVLWIFGILASLGGGGGGSNASYSVSSEDFGRGGQPELPPRIQRFFDQIDPSVLVAVVGGLICLALLIGLILLVLSVIGRGGLIGGVQLADANGRVTFGEAWGAGLRHFWTLFFIGLVVGLVILALVIVTVVPGVLLAIATLGLGVLCLIPLVCVLVIVSIVLGIVAYFAQIAAVVENLGLTAALSRAWQVIRSNLGPIIVLGIILAVINGIASFILFLPLLAVVFPPVFGAITGDAGGLRAGIVIAVLCFIAYLPVLLVVGGVLQTWITSAWTLAYQQFTRPAASSTPAPTL